MTTLMDEPIVQGLTEQEALERLARMATTSCPLPRSAHSAHIMGDRARADVPAADRLRRAIPGLGDPEEALMLLGFVFVVIGITFYQEQKTERPWRRCAISPARAPW